MSSTGANVKDRHGLRQNTAITSSYVKYSACELSKNQGLAIPKKETKKHLFIQFYANGIFFFFFLTIEPNLLQSL